VTEDRKLQVVAAPSRSGEGFTLYVLRDPHPPQNVPVAFETVPMVAWSPLLATDFLVTAWGWAPAPGATWEALTGDRYRLRPLVAAGETK
jgi:hypothetical protein